MDLDLVTGPAADAHLSVVSLDDMRKHLRITATSRDDVISSAIADAVAEIHGPRGELRRSVLACRWKLWLHAFPSLSTDFIEIPVPPLVAVDGISYLDADGVEQALGADVYVTVPGTVCGRVYLARGKTWPVLLDHPRAVGIAFSAGYDWSDTTNPDLRQIRRAVKLLAAHYYENAEATIIEGRITNASKKTEYGLDFIFDRLRVPLDYT